MINVSEAKEFDFKIDIEPTNEDGSTYINVRFRTAPDADSGIYQELYSIENESGFSVEIPRHDSSCFIIYVPFGYNPSKVSELIAKKLISFY